MEKETVIQAVGFQLVDDYNVHNFSAYFWPDWKIDHLHPPRPFMREQALMNIHKQIEEAVRGGYWRSSKVFIGPRMILKATILD